MEQNTLGNTKLYFSDSCLHTSTEKCGCSGCFLPQTTVLLLCWKKSFNYLFHFITYHLENIHNSYLSSEGCATSADRFIALLEALFQVDNIDYFVWETRSY